MFGTARRPDPAIDLTPMIDVIFQLVLFFMVTMNQATYDALNAAPGIEVDLPRASAEAVISDARDISLWMARDGAVYADEVSVSTPELVQILRARARVDPSTQVVIKADQGVPHGRVVAVMDLARNQGLTRLAIATEIQAED